MLGAGQFFQVGQFGSTDEQFGSVGELIALAYDLAHNRLVVTAAKAQIDAFDKTLDTYRLDVGRYPTTEEGLNALVVAPPKPGVGEVMNTRECP